MIHCQESELFFLLHETLLLPFNQLPTPTHLPSLLRPQRTFFGTLHCCAHSPARLIELHPPASLNELDKRRTSASSTSNAHRRVLFIPSLAHSQPLAPTLAHTLPVLLLSETALRPPVPPSEGCLPALAFFSPPRSPSLNQSSPPSTPTRRGTLRSEFTFSMCRLSCLLLHGPSAP